MMKINFYFYNRNNIMAFTRFYYFIFNFIIGMHTKKLFIFNSKLKSIFSHNFLNYKKVKIFNFIYLFNSVNNIV